MLSRFASFIPFRTLKMAFYQLRAIGFTVERPDQPHIVTDAEIEEVQRVLAEAHFTNSWELSYRYRGEDLNMRRPLYLRDEYHWYQLHVRGFDPSDPPDTDGGSLRLHAHTELEPTEYPKKHLAEDEFYVTEGLLRLGQVLDGEIEYEYAGVDVDDL